MIDKEKLLNFLVNFPDSGAPFHEIRDAIFWIFSKINEGYFDVKESNESKKIEFLKEKTDDLILIYNALSAKIELRCKSLEDKISDINNQYLHSEKQLSDLEEIVKDEAIKTYDMQDILGRFKEAFDDHIDHYDEDHDQGECDECKKPKKTRG